MGARRRGRRRSRGRRGRPARGDVAADDDPARPVGEHAARHARRVRRGRRGRRHRAGAPVRRRDPRRIPRYVGRFRAPHRPQHPAATAGGVARRAGCWTRPAGPGTSRSSPSSWRSRPGNTFRPSSRRGGFVDACDFIADQIAEVAAQRADDIAHRRTAITGVNEFPNLAEPALPQDDSRTRRSPATPRSSRRCATVRTSTWRAPARGRRRCCCRWARWPSTTSARRSRPTCWRPAASRRSTRGRSTPAASPRPCEDAGSPPGGGHLRHRQALRGRGRIRRAGGPRRRRIEGLSGRAGEGGGGPRGATGRTNF